MKAENKSEIFPQYLKFACQETPTSISLPCLKFHTHL